VLKGNFTVHDIIAAINPFTPAVAICVEL